MQFNKQQEALFTWATAETGSCNLIARAGTGKTTTIIELANRIQGRAFLGAFNKAIAEELKTRIKKPNVTAGTMHSLGFQLWRGICKGKSEIDSRKVRGIVRRLQLYPMDKNVADLLCGVVAYGKQSGLGLKGLDYTKEETWTPLLDHHDVWDELPATISPNRFVTDCITVYDESILMCQEEDPLIDFEDMLLAPLMFSESKPNMYDWVMIDECLIGDTPVLLGDGSLRTIQDIVDSKNPVIVQSYDPKRKQTVKRRVTGWYKKPLEEKLIRIVTRRQGYRKDGGRMAPLSEYVHFGHRIVVCTENHIIRSDTQDDWTLAKDLQVGDCLVEESHTPRDKNFQNKYKHGRSGLENLSREMARKNKSGSCGLRRTSGRITKQGGNGRGATKFQTALLDRLGDPWVVEFVVVTGGKKGENGLPTHYKLDLADAERKVAIELDGGSHQSKTRQDQDAKKDAFLKSLGWLVIRISNRESITLTQDLVEERVSNSPVLTEVVSIEEFRPQDPYVYDIDVEETHNFYANGIVVHNCQDTNEVRRRLAQWVLRPNGRMVAVGDPKQSIYGFCGASEGAMDLIKRDMNSIELPLTITYRCPKQIVALAQTLVPDIQAHESSPEGTITAMSSPEFFRQIFSTDDVILCRNTRPLIGVAKRLRKMGIPCVVEGANGKALIGLATKWGENITIGEMETRLGVYSQEQYDKWSTKHRMDKAEGAVERKEILMDIASELSADDLVTDLVKHIEKMFGDRDNDDRQILRLCTVHRSKGREWKRVFLLGRNLYMPSKWAEKEWELGQEDNLVYVAWTRVKEELVEVTCKAKKNSEDPDWWEL
jgi:superfamily I DNA/RNA helicase